MVFGSKTAKQKLQRTGIQCRFGDSEIFLNFRKQISPLRNGRKPIFVTILLPEFISDQVVRLPFSNFRKVVSVFKGRHEFNRKIRNGKRHFKIFPAGGDPAVLPRKIFFHGRIQRDVLFAEKKVFCYRCKTRHMLGQNCPVATPKILACLKRSRVILQGKIWLQYDLNLLLRLSLLQSLSRHFLLLAGGRG